MKVLVTGICGFVGNALARRIKAAKPAVDVFGVDNLMRLGSEANRRLARDGIRVSHGDIRCASDIDALGAADWVIDAAANPSVLAGFDNRSNTRQLIEHNLFGTVNLLEYCRRYDSGGWHREGSLPQITQEREQPYLPLTDVNAPQRRLPCLAGWENRNDARRTA
jgi:CDP-paratose 2-epimerase